MGGLYLGTTMNTCAYYFHKWKNLDNHNNKAIFLKQLWTFLIKHRERQFVLEVMKELKGSKLIIMLGYD